jgi:hypothetical protein
MKGWKNMYSYQLAKSFYCTDEEERQVWVCFVVLVWPWQVLSAIPAYQID